MSEHLVVCKICKTVPLVKYGAFYYHGEGERRRECHVTYWLAREVERPPQPSGGSEGEEKR